MPKDIVYLDPNLRTQTINVDKLRATAKDVAHSIMLPKGIELAQFEFGGKRYALEAQLSIQVSCLNQKVEGLVLRDGDLKAAREAAELKRKAQASKAAREKS